MLRAIGKTATPASRGLPWQKRWDIAVLCFFAQVIGYCDRVNISVAAPEIMRERHWNTVQMGWVFTAFFLGYTLSMIPIGMCIDRYGAKLLLAVGVIWWSVFTALTPMPRTLLALSGTRCAMGIGESGILPATNAMLVRWFPSQEYSQASGLCWSGGYAGSIVAFPLASAIGALWGWRCIFYAFASLALLLTPLLLLSTSNSPEENSSVSPEEAAYIVRNRPALSNSRRAPWYLPLRTRSVWALLLLHFSSNWFIYVLVSWLPTYLLVVRHFSITGMAFGASLPFMAALAGANLFAHMIDRLSLKVSRTRVHRSFVTVYALGSIFLLATCLVSDRFLTVLFLCLAGFFVTAATPVYSSNSLYLAPRYAGTLAAMQNCFANFAGIVAPVVTGYVAKALGWTMVFLVVGLVTAIGITAFNTFGTTERLFE
jgi:ACS family D-galactonate transporter-like MFS transporter